MSYYKTIDELPLWNYWQVLHKKDLNFLIKEGKHGKKVLQEAWNIIEEEVNDIAIQWKDSREELEKRVRFAQKMCNAGISGNPFDNHMIKVELEAEKKATPQRKLDVYDIIAVMESQMKISIDEKTVTVRKYLAYIKRLKNG